MKEEIGKSWGEALIGERGGQFRRGGDEEKNIIKNGLKIHKK